VIGQGSNATAYRGSAECVCVCINVLCNAPVNSIASPPLLLSSVLFNCYMHSGCCACLLLLNASLPCKLHTGCTITIYEVSQALVPDHVSACYC
jgi:hypothetical protein